MYLENEQNESEWISLPHVIRLHNYCCLVQLDPLISLAALRKRSPWICNQTPKVGYPLAVWIIVDEIQRRALDLIEAIEM